MRICILAHFRERFSMKDENVVNLLISKQGLRKSVLKNYLLTSYYVGTSLLTENCKQKFLKRSLNLSAVLQVSQVLRLKLKLL